MHEAYCETFLERIASYKHFLKSVSVATVAVRKRGSWVHLVGRITTSENPLQANVSISESELYLAQLIHLPIGRFPQLLRSVVVHQRLTVDGDESGRDPQLTPVLLDAVAADVVEGHDVCYSWLGVHRWESERAEFEFRIGRPCIYLFGNGQRVWDIADTAKLEKISSSLRLKHGFDGLEGLIAKWMPGISCCEGDAATLQFVAPVPIDLKQIDPRTIEIRAPTEALKESLRAVIHFKPAGTAILEECTQDRATADPRTGLATIRLTVAWPQNAETAKVVVALGEAEMDTSRIERWRGASCVRLAVDSFFDPQRKELLGRLRSVKSVGAVDFELAVVRLMNLLEIPMIWYGQATKPQRPDGAACLVRRDGSRVVLLAECTLEKPSEKFSGLRKRADELKEYLEGEADVRAVVFAGCEVAEAEIGHAGQLGIRLVGRSRIEWLCEVLSEGRSNPDKAVDEVLGLSRDI